MLHQAMVFPWQRMASINETPRADRALVSALVFDRGWIVDANSLSCSRDGTNSSG